MKRILLAGGAVGLLLAASACSAARPDAATVNGDTIGRRDFESTLQAYADNEPYRTAVAAQGGTPILGPAGDGTVSMAFTNQILRREILIQLVRQAVEERGLTVTPEAQEQASQQAASFTLGLQDSASLESAWGAFPQSFRDDAIEDTAYVNTLTEALGGGALDDAELQAIFDENPGKFGRLCASHILVAGEDEAEQALARLDAGEDFAAVAAELSSDGSAQDGGKLYTDGEACPLALGFVAPFVDGAADVEIGRWSGPVQSEFGWHIIRVDKREPVTFDEVKSQLTQYLSQNANAALTEVLTEGARSDITVAPRYGSWDAGRATVVPPGSETTTSTPNAPATTAPAATTG